MVAHTGISEREFAEEFASAEDCFLAAFDDCRELVSRALLEAVQTETRWLTRVRIGLVSMLRLFDAQPDVGRLLVVATPAAGVRALERREQVLARLGELLERGSPGPQTSGCLALQRGLMAELVIGGVLSVLHGRMVRHERMPLIELAPPLMSLIVLPYLGAEAANAELARKHAPVASTKERRVRRQLPTRATHRTILVLRAIESVPRSNNREVAAAAGMGDEGQTSRMLSRLQRQGLIENVGLGQAYGEPNAWLLTDSGSQLAAQPEHRAGVSDAARQRSEREGDVSELSLDPVQRRADAPRAGLFARRSSRGAPGALSSMTNARIRVGHRPARRALSHTSDAGMVCGIGTPSSLESKPERTKGVVDK